MTEFLWTLLPFLIPLLGLSIYGVGLILHKAAALRHAKTLEPVRFSSLLENAARGTTEHDLPTHHPLAYLLTHASDPAPLLQARAHAWLGRLEDRLSYLPALANVATLTGLFGTVCGMIGAFLSLKSGGGADPSSLAGGLGMALIATALGLVTAIPALAAHAVFQKRIQAVSVQMEALLSALLHRGGRP